MTNKKKLLIIVPHCCDGGAQKSAARLSELMDDEFEVYMITFFSEAIFPTAYTYKGTFISLNQVPSRSIFRKITNAFARRRFLKKFKITKKIDIAVSYTHAAHTANILSAGKEKTIVSLRTLLSKNVKSRLEAFTIKRLYHRADIVVAQNDRALQDAIAHFNIIPNKTSVIPNFYNFKTIEAHYATPLPSEFPPTDKYHIFTQVGRLHEAKGQWHLLRIFKGVLTKNPQARLLIAGVGDLLDFLKTYTTQLNIKVQDLTKTPEKIPDLEQYQVILLGFVRNPYQYYSVTDMFLFTSIYEGFPNALAEAMICSLPVLSTDCTTGPRELIAPETKDITNYPHETAYGVLFPPFDGAIPEATTDLHREELLWVKLIGHYLKNPALLASKGEQAKERMQHFGKDRVKKMWLELIK